MNISLEEVQNQIIEDFAVLEEWMDKYEYLIDLSKDLPAIAENDKTPSNLIKGCQSRVWLSCSISDEGFLQFKADSDAVITKGIISLLLRVLSNRTPHEIMKAEMGWIDKIGLKENLSPTRANGLVSMIKQIKNYALAFQTLQNK